MRVLQVGAILTAFNRSLARNCDTPYMVNFSQFLHCEHVDWDRETTFVFCPACISILGNIPVWLCMGDLV